MAEKAFQEDAFQEDAFQVGDAAPAGDKYRFIELKPIYAVDEKGSEFQMVEAQ